MACASWASFLAASLPAEVEPLVSAVCLPPPNGWRPANGDDPLLVAAFARGWPAGVHDAPPPPPTREVERDEVVADALERLSPGTRAPLIEHAGGWSATWRCCASARSPVSRAGRSG